MGFVVGGVYLPHGPNDLGEFIGIVCLVSRLATCSREKSQRLKASLAAPAAPAAKKAGRKHDPLGDRSWQDPPVLKSLFYFE